jgi:putative heme-binding domain-containing protein
VRETVLGALLSQPRHVGAVLDALEAGVIPPGAIDANRRKQLAQHRDAPVRARAEKLFAALVPGDRMKAYEECKAALALPADARAGRDVFKRLCAQCHRLDREGVAVGPDLFGIRNQPKEAILLHLVVPEYEILPGFAAYEIETRDGRTLSGLIAGETATSVTLRGGQGMEETILRGNIARLTASALSLMPQELEQQMTRQELADLLAFLKGEAERR